MGPRADADTPLGTRALLGQVGAGMGVLRELVDKVPKIHDSAVEFRVRFDAACQQMHVLRTYKELHDQLHNLQFRCYETMIHEVMCFPDDSAAENIELHAEELQDIIATLQAIARCSPFITPPPFWIKTLVQAHADIRAALHRNDATLLRDAVNQIKRVLATHPSAINSQLNLMVHLVREMHLAALINMITNIRTVCAHLGVEPNEITPLDASRVALTELDQRLATLAKEHNQWQVVDAQLWVIDDLPADHAELELHWEYLKEDATSLYASCSEQWADRLRVHEARIDNAVLNHDGVRIKEHFGRYRRQAIRQFYTVDKNFKNTCETLERHDGPLAPVRGLLA